MKTINEYIEQEYIDELNIIEESIFDDEEEQLEKVEKDLQKQLKIVAKSDKMNDKDWIRELLGFGGWGSNYQIVEYYGKSYDYEIQRSGWHGDIERRDGSYLVDILKQYKCFNTVLYLPGAKRVVFKYNRKKDVKREETIAKEIEFEMERLAQYKKDVENADTTKWVPDAANVVKMKGYYAKGSDPARIAKACGDDKLIKRFLIAIGMKWDKAVREFRWEIKTRKLLTDAEIEAYENKYRDFVVN
jgi:hypothetical protein